MKSLSFYEQQHILRLLKQEGQVKYIFDEFVRKSGLILSRWKSNGSENVWIRNALLENELEKEIIELHKRLLASIKNNAEQEWKLANKKTDDLVNGFIKDLAISEVVKKGMFSHNEKAMRIFLNRNVDGMTISDKVWDIASGAKTNLEYYLKSGLSSGRPAALISQDIRQLLNDPDRRFHRIRNDDGKLVPSKPMKGYNPGRGVYRSSYKNALRIAATETNTSYHLADHERWKNLGFVLGIEVSRSRSAKEPCPVCDVLVGRYPKDFVFVPWHPWCICQAVPVMLGGEEYTDYLLTGKIPENRIIRTIPEAAKEYINNNADKIMNAPRRPPWVEHNFVDSDIRKGTVSSKTRRKELQVWAKENIKGTAVLHNGFGREIEIRTSSIKEFLNQPHKHKDEKNELLKNIHSVIQSSVYVGKSEYHKENRMIKYSHIFETVVAGEKSWIIVREDVHRKATLYSISDSDKVLIDIKEK